MDWIFSMARLISVHMQVGCMHCCVFRPCKRNLSSPGQAAMMRASSHSHLIPTCLSAPGSPRRGGSPVKCAAHRRAVWSAAHSLTGHSLRTAMITRQAAVLRRRPLQAIYYTLGLSRFSTRCCEQSVTLEHNGFSLLHSPLQHPVTLPVFLSLPVNDRIAQAAARPPRHCCRQGSNATAFSRPGYRQARRACQHLCQSRSLLVVSCSRLHCSAAYASVPQVAQPCSTSRHR